MYEDAACQHPDGDTRADDEVSDRADGSTGCTQCTGLHPRLASFMFYYNLYVSSPVVSLSMNLCFFTSYMCYLGKYVLYYDDFNVYQLL